MWKAVHIYYYDDAKDDLVLRGIRPVLHEISAWPGVHGYYLRRHWKFGPHVALFLDVEEAVFAERVWPHLESAVGAYLQANPSRQEIDPVAYAKRSMTLGAWELEPGPYEPMQPDNSLSVHPYGQQRADVMNGEQVLHTIETFWKNTISTVLDVMEATRDQMPRRQLYIIQLMTTLAQLFPKYGIARGHLSYRSHYEGYLKEFDPQGRVLAVYKQQDEQAAAWVDEAVAAVLQDTDERGVYRGTDAILRAWSEQLLELYQACFDLAKQGLLSSNTDHYGELAKSISTEAQERWKNEIDESQLSAFHTRLFSLDGREQFFNSPEFVSYRILVNSFYTYLPLLGINPNVKHLICYLISRSVERVLHIDWRGIFDTVEAASGKGVRPAHEAES